MIEFKKLTVFRIIIFIIFICLCIASSILILNTFQFLFNPNRKSNTTIYYNLYSSTVCILFSFIVYKIYSVIKSLKSNPLTENNIKNFKIIYRCMVVIAILNGIFTYTLPDNPTFQFLQTSYGSVKPTCILYFILAVVALTLSYIFEKAIEIKNENDLTV